MQDKKKGSLLSKRLQEVASFVPQGTKLLDIGSDHAYLPIYLIKQGQIDWAVASEVAQGPYQSAMANVTQAHLTDRIDLRLADGLQALDEAEVIDLVSICGMGGRLIADILEAGLDRLSRVKQLILQPNNCEDDLRFCLMNRGFKIVAEKILVDHGKYYEILLVEKGEMSLSAQDLRFGPFLRKESSPIFKARWQKELSKLERALVKIPQTNRKDYETLSRKMRQIKEVLYASSKDH